MAVGWNGADPVAVIDPGAYELGTAYIANVDVTLTHIRIWAGSSEVNYPGRTATIWSTGGSPLATLSIPTDLPDGWSTHALMTPVARTTGQQWIVSYTTGGNYAFLSHGLDSDVPSADVAVTALGFASAPGTINGRFNVVPGSFPATGNASHAFYGADVSYIIGIGGNTAPSIMSATVTAVQGTATASIQAVDAETLIGAHYAFDWGDGTSPSVVAHPTTSASHTYARSGLYSVLMSVTDADGLTRYAAAPVSASVPVPGIYPVVIMPDPLGLIIDLLSTHPQLPSELVGKVVAELPDDFPDRLPWLTVEQVPGATSRPVVYRVGQASFDVNVYDFDNAKANTYARTIAALAQSLMGKSNSEGGIVDIHVTEPFPLPDITRAHRWIVQILVSYRPLT